MYFLNNIAKHDNIPNNRKKDRTILVYTATNLEDTKTRKSLRINVQYDHGIRCAWSPDCKAILIHKAIENCIEVYKLEKRDGFFVNPTKGVTFPKMHEDDIVGFGIACTGRFLMSCTNKTEIIVWNIRGNVLDKLDTCLMTNYSAKISPCGRFIAACGFSPDVKVWAVKFKGIGEYQKTVRAFELSGHTSGVYDIAFDQDTSHIATVSKDGTWKIFDTNIEYEKGQTASCVMTAKYSPSSTPALIALSMDAQVVVIASANDLEIFSALTGIRDRLIENIFIGGIVGLMFDPLGKYILAAGDRFVRVFHNVTGYRISNECNREKLKQTQTFATKERLEKMIEDNEAFLQKFKDHD